MSFFFITFKYVLEKRKESAQKNHKLRKNKENILQRKIHDMYLIM